MNQLSVRGFDKDLMKRLREVARREDLSLNRAALVLLRRGAGLAEKKEASAAVGDALDRFIGTWSKNDERALLRGITACESIDEDMWK